MPVVLEATGQLRLHRHLATLQFVGRAAHHALEVMVMRLPCHLVARGRAGNLHRGQPAGLQQGCDIAVDGGNADTFDLFLRQQQHFLRRKRTVSLLECLANCVLLPGIAGLHCQSAVAPGVRC